MKFNCPSCHTGVLEPLAILDLTEGQSKIQYLVTPIIPEDAEGVILYMCSNDIVCNHVEMRAIPGTFSRLKKYIRELAFSPTNILP